MKIVLSIYVVDMERPDLHGVGGCVSQSSLQRTSASVDLVFD